MKLHALNTTSSLPGVNFSFLNDMFTMSAQQIEQIARNIYGYQLSLSTSQDPSELLEETSVSRVTVLNASGQYWIKYS